MPSLPQEIYLLSFFISYFTVSVAASISRPDFYSDSAIFIISFISSFEVNKVNSFPALTTPFPLSNTDEFTLVANLGKTSVAKEMARSNNTFLPKLANFLPRNLPH